MACKSQRAYLRPLIGVAESGARHVRPMTGQRCPVRRNASPTPATHWDEAFFRGREACRAARPCVFGVLVDGVHTCRAGPRSRIGLESSVYWAVMYAQGQLAPAMLMCLMVPTAAMRGTCFG